MQVDDALRHERAGSGPSPFAVRDAANSLALNGDRKTAQATVGGRYTRIFNRQRHDAARFRTDSGA